MRCHLRAQVMRLAGGPLSCLFHFVDWLRCFLCFVVRRACLDLGLEAAATKLMKSRSSSDELQGMCARVGGLVAVR